MTNDTCASILKLPSGGYIVTEGYGDPGSWRQQLFASSTIDEALEFIKSRLEPLTPDK